MNLLLLQVELSQLYFEFRKNECLQVSIAGIQKQQGANDCGLFAIANALEFALGYEPTSAYYEQTKMRHHLLKCLVDQVIERFPQTNAPHTGSRQQLIPSSLMRIHCMCECGYADTYDSEHIRCPSCKRHYHKKCMKMDIENSPNLWICLQCQRTANKFIIFAGEE